MTRRRKIKVVLLTLAMMGAGQSQSSGIPVVDVANVAQSIQQTLNSAIQINNQVKAIQYQVQSLENLGRYDWGNTTNALNQLSSVLNTTRSLAYTMGNLQRELDKYKPLEHQRNNPQSSDQQHSRSQERSAATMATIQGTMNSMSVQYQQLNDEIALMERLKSSVSGSTGQVQAIQAAAQISAHQVEQLQKMKLAIMTQTQMQAAVELARQEEQAERQAAWERFVKPVSNTKGDEGKF